MVVIENDQNWNRTGIHIREPEREPNKKMEWNRNLLNFKGRIGTEKKYGFMVWSSHISSSPKNSFFQKILRVKQIFNGYLQDFLLQSSTPFPVQST